MACSDIPEFCAFSCARQSFRAFPLAPAPSLDCAPEEELLLGDAGCSGDDELGLVLLGGAGDVVCASARPDVASAIAASAAAT
jgi:hypothetical protein